MNQGVLGVGAVVELGSPLIKDRRSRQRLVRSFHRDQLELQSHRIRYYSAAHSCCSIDSGIDK